MDDFTVAFHLAAPNGNFPYLTSSDNYNMIILPNGYDPAKWQSTFIGTGPFVLKSYTAKQGATFARNEKYWGTKALPAATEFTFYDQQTPQILALTGGTIDVVGQFSVAGGEQLLNGSYNVIKLKSSAHRELSMRCDQAPFTDPRVRQAIALTLDRPAIIHALFKGFADLGNDSPFAPVFPSTNTTVAAAGPEHRQGEVAAVRRRAPVRVLDPADRQRRAGDPRVRADRGAGGEGHRGEHQRRRWRPRRRTTARPRSGTRTGWTPR